MSTEAVKFEYKNGYVGAVNLAVAEKLEKKLAGKVIKGTPDPVVKKGEIQK